MISDIKTLNKKIYGARIERGHSTGPTKMNLDRYISHLTHIRRKLLARTKVW